MCTSGSRLERSQGLVPSRCLDDLEALVLQRINGASTDRQFVFGDNDHTTIEEPFTLFPGLPSPE